MSKYQSNHSRHYVLRQYCLPICHFRNAWYVQFVWFPWDLSSHRCFRWCGTNHDAKSPSSTPLYLHHYPKLAWHTSGRVMYDSMRWDLYWAPTANDVYMTVRNCRSCTRNRASLKKNRHPKLFSANAPFKFIAEIYCSQSKSLSGNLFIISPTDRCTKILPATRLSKPLRRMSRQAFSSVRHGIEDSHLSHNVKWSAVRKKVFRDVLYVFRRNTS